MAEKLTPSEIHSRLNKPDTAITLHREAVEAGMPLANYLEVLDPTPAGERGNAFSRQLREAGIVTNSDPAAGYWASEGGVFVDTPAGRALFPEFYAREWRKVAYATPAQRAILLSSDAVLNTFERPYTDVGPLWQNQFVPAISLNEVVATTTPIRGEDYRSTFINYDEEAVRMYRVGESAEIPMANLVTSERSIRLKKYGRGLRATYEQMRRVRVDKIAWWIRWQALQSEVDKVSAAIDVLVNGDGNANTAATVVDITTLGGVSGTLDLRSWLSFRMSFTSPYALTTIFANLTDILDLIMLNLGTANIPLANFDIAGIGNSFTPINATADGIRYAWTDEAPADRLVAFDRRFALEHITEIGSEISETERYITNQTQVITMTENSAFAVLDPNASKVLDVVP
jgi:hypothetical protein